MRELTPSEIENFIKVDRLKKVMRDCNFYRIKTFAENIGISANYLSELLSGKRPIPKNLGYKLEESLGVCRVWFESGEVKEKPTTKSGQISELFPKGTIDSFSTLLELCKDPIFQKLIESLYRYIRTIKDAKRDALIAMGGIATVTEKEA